MKEKVAWVVALSLSAAPIAWFLATLPPIDSGSSVVGRSGGPALGDSRRQVDLAGALIHATPARDAEPQHARAGTRARRVVARIATGPRRSARPAARSARAAAP